jgi:hypothetical protein
MASQVSHLPHIKNVAAGMARWDPVYQSIFSVGFTVPSSMAGEYDQNEMLILSQQVISISGLDNLQSSIKTYTQKYLGVDVAFYYPTLDNTGIDYTIQFNLNIRNKSDVYVFKIFKQWLNLIYSASTGVVALKAQTYGKMIILEANRDGTIWRQVVLKNVIVTDVKGMETLDYTSSDVRTLNVTFHADYWDETIG